MKKHTGPIIAALLLLLPVLYVVSYFALVVPAGIWGTPATPLASVAYLGTYRCGDTWGERLFWPLEKIDRKLRPQAWRTNLNSQILDFDRP